MAQAFDRIRAPALLAFAFLFPVAVYRAHACGPLKANAIDKAVLAVTMPVQRFLVGAVGRVSDTWHLYVDVVDARRAESELQRRLDRSERERMALEVLEVENEHLRALLNLESLNPDHRLVAARVVGAGLDPGVQVLRVDKGALEGLQRGHPVLSGQGLVGRVLEVAWTTADVQLIADARVSVPAKILRTGAQGRLRGRGDPLNFGLELSEVLRSDDVQPGDRVVSSGLGGTYPAGVPIGVVTRLYMEKGVPHRFADVLPFADFARLEVLEVVVRPKPGVPLVTPEPLLPPALRARADGGGVGPDALGEWPPPAVEATESLDAGVAQ